MNIRGRATSTVPSPTRDKPLAWLARIGWAAKGIILLALGLLIVSTARSRPAASMVDERGALREIHRHSYGSVLVATLAAGLLCYAIWQAARGIADPEREGNEWPALLKR